MRLPLALLSVYLGKEMEDLLVAVEGKKDFVYNSEITRDLQIPSLPLYY